MTSTVGPTAARIGTIETGGDGYTRLAQPQTNPTRELPFRTVSGSTTEYLDPMGRVTTFDYATETLSFSVTAPGVQTQFG